MNIADLTREVLSLSPRDRAIIAQQVWDSLDDSQAEVSAESESAALTSATERDEEMSVVSGEA
jgi:hypothetical protein